MYAFCPLCIQEMSQRTQTVWIRSEWAFVFQTQCARHRTPLRETRAICYIADPLAIANPPVRSGLQGLSPRCPAEYDDTASRRVYASLPVARAGRRLPAYPLLRLHGQPIPGTETSTLPRTLGHANARTTGLGNRRGLS